MNESVELSLEILLKTEKQIECALEPACVFFADLVDSTRFKATHSVAEGLKRSLFHNRSVVEQIVLNGGTVVKFIGDEVMGVFKDASLATRAAVSIHQELKSSGMVPRVQTKIAIHRGPLVFFKYEQATTLDPQGTTVDVAARIAGCAKAGQVLVSSQVKDATADGIIFTTGTSFIPRGTREPVIVHAVHFPEANLDISLASYVPFLSEELSATLSEAKELLNQRKYRDAALLATQVLRADKRHPEAAYIFGVCCSSGQFGDFQKGIEALEQVLLYNPNDFRTQAYLAYLIWASSDGSISDCTKDRLVALTEQSHQRAQDLEDKYTELVVSNSLAFFLAERGLNDDLHNAYRICQKSAATYDWLQSYQYSKFLDTFGYVLMKMGDLDGAQEKFRQACEVDPEFAEALIHLGEVIQLKKRQR